jgi:site-specific DNA-methyltransferase (adenine-specific)
MIEDNSVDLIYTDLPYGNQTHNKWDKSINLEQLWIDYKRVLKPKGTVILHSQGMFTAKLMLSNERWWRYNLVWNKVLVSGFLNANRQMLRCHEDILVFYKKLGTFNPQFTTGCPLHSKGSKYKFKEGTNNNYGYYDSTKDDIRKGSTQKYPKSILNFIRPKNSIHPTQKSLELSEYIIKTYSNEGDLVLDSTSGSGTIPLACTNTNRNWIAFELDKTYFDLATKRIEKM